MRLKIFTIVFIVMIMVVLGSSLLVYTQLLKLRGINLDVLEDKLYSENTEILSWSLKTIDVTSLQKNKLPASWAEIMAVDNDSLVISASTDTEHKGLAMYKLPELLDQSSAIIDAIKSKKSVNVTTEAYMIAIIPLKDNRSLVGFKPKSWEKNILDEQNSQINRDKASIKVILLIYCGAGFILAFIAAFVVSSMAAKPTQKMAKAFEQLSIGNFDVEIPSSGGKVFVSLAESFFRLRTSLMMALERLGGK